MPRWILPLPIRPGVPLSLLTLTGADIVGRSCSCDRRALRSLVADKLWSKDTEFLRSSTCFSRALFSWRMQFESLPKSMISLQLSAYYLFMVLNIYSISFWFSIVFLRRSFADCFSTNASLFLRFRTLCSNDVLCLSSSDSGPTTSALRLVQNVYFQGSLQSLPSCTTSVVCEEPTFCCTGWLVEFSFSLVLLSANESYLKSPMSFMRAYKEVW